MLAWGVLFRQAFDAASACSPHSCGMFGLINRGFELHDGHEHLASWLKGQGCATALAGSQHEVRDPRTSNRRTCGSTPSGATTSRGERRGAVAAAFLLGRCKRNMVTRCRLDSSRSRIGSTWMSRSAPDGSACGAAIETSRAGSSGSTLNATDMPRAVT